MFAMQTWYQSEHSQSIEKTGEKMKHLRKNHWFIKTIATTISSIKSLKMKFFHTFLFYCV